MVDDRGREHGLASFLEHKGYKKNGNVRVDQEADARRVRADRVQVQERRTEDAAAAEDHEAEELSEEEELDGDAEECWRGLSVSDEDDA